MVRLDLQRGTVARLLVILLLVGCSRSSPNAVTKSKTDQPDKKPVAEYTLAFFATMPPTKLIKNWQPICDYILEKTGISLEIRIFKKYNDIISLAKKNHIHLVFGGTFLYLVIHNTSGFIPLVKRVFDGFEKNRSIFIVRRDSPILTLNDLKGKKLAFTDRTSTTGYLYPTIMMAKVGILDLNNFFSEIVLTGNPESTLLAVYNKEVDAAGISDRVFEKYPFKQKKLRILASSYDIPLGPLSCSLKVQPKHREQLKEIFLSLAEFGRMRYHLQNMGVRGFEPSFDSEFDQVRQDIAFLDALGIKIEDLFR